MSPEELTWEQEKAQSHWHEAIQHPPQHQDFSSRCSNVFCSQVNNLGLTCR